jgi:hypothetical protein
MPRELGGPAGPVRSRAIGLLGWLRREVDAALGDNKSDDRPAPHARDPRRFCVTFAAPALSLSAAHSTGVNASP